MKHVEGGTQLQHYQSVSWALSLSKDNQIFLSKA